MKVIRPSPWLRRGVPSHGSKVLRRADITGPMGPASTCTRSMSSESVRFYKNSVESLVSLGKLADLRLEEITSEHVAGFVARRQLDEVEVSTINRDLSTLRRMFHLAVEWGKVKTLLPKVKLLPRENHRERVLSLEEEAEYVQSARVVGDKIEAAYQKALTGIRAVQRRQPPRRPDSYLLFDVVTTSSTVRRDLRSASA
ncbi:MAG: hypothetical protein EXQ52_10955 [Bryobacterales bacterium]|nr:hypothetical protein [Bryobacterales bacterium]